MAKIYPFKAFRPKPEYAYKIAAPPYDVLDSDEAREVAKDKDMIFLHVTKSEIDLPPSIDPYDDKVYQKAAENLQKFINNSYIVQDHKPNLYIYTQKMGEHLQKGLVACVSVEDYVNNIIKKHELTRADKEKDRCRHIETTNAQTGPVFITYQSTEDVNSIIDREMKKNPVYNFTTSDGIVHTVYVIDDENVIKSIVDRFGQIPYLYIADGHHRSAAGSIVGLDKKKKNPNHTGDEEYNKFLAVLFPHDQLKIMDYNRVVKDLNGLSKEEFLAAAQKNFIIEEKSSQYKPEKLHTFAMYIDKQWHKLTPKDGTFDSGDVMRALDVSILQDNLLSPILAIGNPRTDKRINFVGGIRGLKELERLVDSDKYKVAFALHPVSVEELMAIADAGQIMPPKSTWFEPKLRCGLFVHILD